MYNTTTTLAAALATQKLYTKVMYGSTTIGAEQVKKCVYSGSFGGADTVTIGGVTAAMVTLTLSGAHNLRDKTITVSIGADVSGTVQYVPLAPLWSPPASRSMTPRRSPPTTPPITPWAAPTRLPCPLALLWRQCCPTWLPSAV